MSRRNKAAMIREVILGAPPYRPPQRKVVQAHNVRRHAARAIAERLGSPMPEAILSCDRDPDTAGAMLLHVNSGGNAIECENALRSAGYRVEPGDPPPGEYGVRLRILPGGEAR
ncbi:hypothetical protein [Nonomuraea sp. NPDC050786]|uniref:hypothetical protein n=1 Tax=Nonomuraea sp. NPDC050786 TaxID=3154840 RepID=UPI00340EF640